MCTAKATGDLNASWHFTNAMIPWLWRNWHCGQALSLLLKKRDTALQCRAGTSPLACDSFSHSHFHFFPVIREGRQTSPPGHMDGQKGYSIFYILRVKATRESKCSVNISRRLLYFPIQQAINEFWTLDVPGQKNCTFQCYLLCPLKWKYIADFLPPDTKE